VFVGLEREGERGGRRDFDVLHVRKSSVGSTCFALRNLDVDNVSILSIKFYELLRASFRCTTASMVGLGTTAYEGALGTSTVIAIAEIRRGVLGHSAIKFGRKLAIIAGFLGWPLRWWWWRGWFTPASADGSPSGAAAAPSTPWRRCAATSRSPTG